MKALVKGLQNSPTLLIEVVAYLVFLLIAFFILSMISHRFDITLALFAIAVALPIGSMVSVRIRNDDRLRKIERRQDSMGKSVQAISQRVGRLEAARKSVQEISARVGKIEKIADKDLDLVRADLMALQLALISENPNGELPTILPGSTKAQ